jgi:Leucine-rich repeat (LRR) protein
VRRQKIALAPTYGAPTLKTPVDDLVRGIRREYSSANILQRRLCWQLPSHELNIDNRQLAEMPEFLATSFAVQLGRWKSARACRNTLSRILSPQSPALTMRQFETVVTLNLNSNKLVELPPDIGLLKCLRSISLDDNLLVALPESFTELKTLTFLSMQQNTFPRLPPDLGELTLLRHLNVRANLLSELCPSFSMLTGLTYLDLR